MSVAPYSITTPAKRETAGVFACPSGGTVYTLRLERSAFGIAGSTPVLGTSVGTGSSRAGVGEARECTGLYMPEARFESWVPKALPRSTPGSRRSRGVVDLTAVERS